ncbi:Ig-like domain-containing protein [Neobacillus sp. LXY-1]|uniref:Ig-like domain-containing protein n=1 Tax=Neobacillus sp. LXY-1 TaxID=3379133 RepID=UPI003EE3ED2B
MRKPLIRISFLFLLVSIIVFFNTQEVTKAETTKSKISFRILSPTLNSIEYNDELSIKISNITSLYQISAVTARVEGREVTLTRTNSEWEGKINLAGLKRGAKTLEVKATDVYGNNATNKTTFTYTKQPKLTIYTPQDFSFTNSFIRIKAEASDLAGEKCTIKITAPDGQQMDAVNKIDTVMYLDLTKMMNRSTSITFVATNETGGTVSITKTLYADPSSYLNKKYQVSGVILDFKDNKILYKTTNNEIKLKDLQTASETTIFAYAGRLKGYITPQGVLLALYSSYYNSLFVYKNSNLIYIGRELLNSPLKVEGNYAIWNGDLKPSSNSEDFSGREIYLLNLETGNAQLVRKDGMVIDVTANGEVIFVSSGAVYRYSDGNMIKLSSSEHVSYTNVFSDGNITVYGDQPSGSYNSKLILNKDGIEKTIDVDSMPLAVNNGYVVYSKSINGTSQIFLWKNGVSKQLTHFGLNVSLESLSANGDVIVKAYGLYSDPGNGYYFINREASTPIRLYTIGVKNKNLNLKNYWIGNELYGVIGGSILRIDPNPIFVTGIKLAETKLTLNTGEQHQLKANILPTTSTNQKVFWSSSNSAVATVNFRGKVMAKKVGTAVITVTTEDGKKQASCRVVVTDITPPKMPVVQAVTNQSTFVTGTAEAGSTITVSIGSKKYLAKANSKGYFKVTIAKQKTGTKILVTATDAAGNTSPARVIIVR